MPNNIGPSIYVPSDKNIYDVLQQKKIKHSEMLKFLRNRGIIVSKKLHKEELSKTISRLTFDYHDYCYITKLLENPNRKERTTGTTIKTSTTNEELIKVCQSVSKVDNTDESYKIVKKDDSIILAVTYTDVDFTKTDLRQRSVKKCEIELQSSNNEVNIRRPATKKGREIVQRIKYSLSEMKGKELEEELISLENLAIPEARSLFFYELIKSIPGYKLNDVSSVDVYHEIDTLDDTSDDDDEDEEDESTSFAGFIRRAALAGGGVLESAEFNQLHSHGFFISKIIWTIVDILPGGDMIELEAQFGTPSSCTDFKYLVRGINKFNDKTATHNITKRPPSKIETKYFNNLLEKTAKIIFTKVIAKYEEQGHEKD